jgi:hypothetical protein
LSAYPSSVARKAAAGRWSLIKIGWSSMAYLRIASIPFLAVALSWSAADSPLSVKRDTALARINACLRRNEVSSRECRGLNKQIETLIDVYRSGDKSVLPTLLQFTYLTDFYGEVLRSDPEFFLTAVTQLPEDQRDAVGMGLAGGPFGLRNKNNLRN